MTDEQDAKGLAGMDLVFSVLRKHEESLDKITRKLEAVVDAITMARDQKSHPILEGENFGLETIRDWKEFKERASSAERILYETSMGFSVRAILPEGQILKYHELFLKPGIPLFKISDIENTQADRTEENKRLDCGLDYTITHTESLSPEGEYTEGFLIALDFKKVKDWLHLQLGVDESRISAGLVVV